MSQLEAQSPDLRVNVQAIIDGLHQRYGQLMAHLLQENAESAAGLDQLQTQLSEALSRIRVMEEMLAEYHAEKQDAGPDSKTSRDDPDMPNDYPGGLR